MMIGTLWPTELNRWSAIKDRIVVYCALERRGSVLKINLYRIERLGFRRQTVSNRMESQIYNVSLLLPIGI
jgi:hypothetical protein